MCFIPLLFNFNGITTGFGDLGLLEYIHVIKIGDSTSNKLILIKFNMSVCRYKHIIF